MNRDSRPQSAHNSTDKSGDQSIEHRIGHIGFFQLSNLLRNKVPYSLFCVDFSTPDELSGELQKILLPSIPCSSESLPKQIREMKLSLEHPLVLLCQNGVKSHELALQLIEQGFVNVYFVRGGWDVLKSEAIS